MPDVQVQGTPVVPGPGGPGVTPAAVVTPPAPAVQEWFTGLPDDLKADAAVFEPFKDKPVADVLKAYRDTAKVAAENAPPKDVAGYKIAMPTFPEGILAPDLKEYLAKAHAKGWTNKMAQGFLNDYAAETAARHEATTAATKKASTALREKWGDKYDANVAFVTRTIDSFPEHLKTIVTNEKLGSEPAFIELVHLVAQARREGAVADGSPGVGLVPTSKVLYGGAPGA